MKEEFTNPEKKLLIFESIGETIEIIYSGFFSLIENLTRIKKENELNNDEFLTFLFEIQKAYDFRAETLNEFVKAYEFFSTFSAFDSVFKPNEKFKLIYLHKWLSNNILEQYVREIFKDFLKNVSLNKELLKMPINELKKYIKQNYEEQCLQGKVEKKIYKGYVTCGVCNRELKYDEYGTNWKFIPVCNECVDFMLTGQIGDVQKRINETIKLLKEKYGRIINQQRKTILRLLNTRWLTKELANKGIEKDDLNLLKSEIKIVRRMVLRKWFKKSKKS